MRAPAQKILADLDRWSSSHRETTFNADGNCHSFDYEPYEDVIDEAPEDPLEDGFEGEDPEADDAHNQSANDENVIVSGDLNSGYSGKVMEQSREKKVPNDQRTTTPYLTKYERARVLGTRALQIRCVPCELVDWLEKMM